MTDTNVRLNTAKELISKGGNVCYAPTEIKGHSGSVDSSPTDFQVGRNDFRILCEGGVCTVQQLVPKVQSFRTEALQALAAIVTLGLTSCSSNEAPKEWQDVAEFQDTKTNDTNLIQPETQVQPNDVSETGPTAKECFDSDDSNYFKAGFVSVDPGKPTQKTYIDICKDTAFLYEQTCDGNQYKKVIVKCADVLPGGMCVESDGGGKCDLGSKYVVDAGSTDSGNDSPDISMPVDIVPDVPDVPPVDYLAMTPVPFSSDKGFSIYPPGAAHMCGTSDSWMGVNKLSTCLYLKAIYDMNGKPVVVSNYGELVDYLATKAKPFIFVELSGNNVYPQAYTGKKVAFNSWTTSYVKPESYENNFDCNMGAFIVNPSTGSIWISLCEKASGKPTDYYKDCLARYMAPNGFAECAPL